jgi:putative membrane protein
MQVLLNWLLSALALMIVARLVPGFIVRNFAWALVAAIVIGFVNATLGAVLKVITLPLAFFTLGIFWIIVNALMLKLASAITPGFEIIGFFAAFWGAVALMIINMIFRWFARQAIEDRR